MPNLATIILDAWPSSTLDWAVPRKSALAAIAQGKHILWQVNLGLFAHLKQPLTHSSQFLTLGLALDHFRDTIWEEFSSYSKGLSLYAGSPDFSQQFAWDKEQLLNFQAWLEEIFKNVNGLEEETGIKKRCFDEIAIGDFQEKAPHILMLYCRDVCGEYIEQLANGVPDRIPLFLNFDASQVQDPLSLLQLTAKDRYERFELQLEKSPLELDPNAPLGICLPPKEMKLPSHFAGLSDALNLLKRHKVPFRVISEERLTVDWDGLDFLIYSPKGLSLSGKRKLLGFNAAGGTAISLGDLLGLPIEASFAEFKIQLAS